jgi:pyruvate dehydrogenase (quinone)
VNVVEEAIKAALAYRTVAHIPIPKDIQDWTSSQGERSSANTPKTQLRLLRRRSPLAFAEASRVSR